MNTKNEISARFIEAYEVLLKSNKVSDKKDFAGKIGISTSMMTEISKGRSSVGTTAIQNIVYVFGISADWLITGSGEMLKTKCAPDQLSAESTPLSLNKDSNNNTSEQVFSTVIMDKFIASISQKDNLIREQAEEIGSLRERIKQLEREKGKSVSDVSDSAHANVG